MPKGRLEHANLSVTDPDRRAALLIDLLDWHIRWSGPSMNDGRTIHVGSSEGYVSLYTNREVAGDYRKGQPLNHVAFAVDDLDAAEAVVVKHGLDPFSHTQYDPGPRSFYFFDWDGIEFEVVSYE